MEANSAVVERRWRRNMWSGRDYTLYVWSSEAPEDFYIRVGRSSKCETALSSWMIHPPILPPSIMTSSSWTRVYFFLLPAICSCLMWIVALYFLADRTNGRAYATVLRLSVVCRRLSSSSSVCLWRYVLWLNGAS